ncbi:hypothetical protein MNV49_007651 [Pseudohyphozyma bogoriensis]|nr:hypothetical protein MNV49_007651 [Pseudohyphozyma bogoriensis]
MLDSWRFNLRQILPVALVSRRLHAIAQPLIWLRPEMSTSWAAGNILTALIRNPKLAGYVRDLRYWWTPQPGLETTIFCFPMNLTSLSFETEWDYVPKAVTDCMREMPRLHTLYFRSEFTDFEDEDFSLAEHCPALKKLSVWSLLRPVYLAQQLPRLEIFLIHLDQDDFPLSDGHLMLLGEAVTKAEKLQLMGVDEDEEMMWGITEEETMVDLVDAFEEALEPLHRESRTSDLKMLTLERFRLFPRTSDKPHPLFLLLTALRKEPLETVILRDFGPLYAQEPEDSQWADLRMSSVRYLELDRGNVRTAAVTFLLLVLKAFPSLTHLVLWEWLTYEQADAIARKATSSNPTESVKLDQGLSQLVEGLRTLTVLSLRFHSLHWLRAKEGDEFELEVVHREDAPGLLFGRKGGKGDELGAG